MHAELLIESIKKHIPLDNEESKLLLSFFKQRKMKKKQFLFQEGDICRYSSFVLKGCLRSFGLDENGVEHVFQFAMEGWWINDMQSFNSETPSMMNVDALEDSEILLISKEDAGSLYRQLPKFERYSRLILENAYISHQERIIQSMCFTAMKRYQYFCDKYPSLVQRLPQTQIASYLGITPEFFSKMRSQLLRQTKTS